MESAKFKYFEKRPCKFVLRSGKTVFGVIWEELNKECNPKYFFTSNSDFVKRQQNAIKNAYVINLDDLIHAELLS